MNFKAGERVRVLNPKSVWPAGADRPDSEGTILTGERVQRAKIIDFPSAAFYYRVIIDVCRGPGPCGSWWVPEELLRKLAPPRVEQEFMAKIKKLVREKEMA